MKRQRSLGRLLLGALFLLPTCDAAGVVERVVLINEIDYSANVDVRGDGDAWLGLTTVPAHQTREVQQVVDQGDRWTFRFAYGPHEGVEVELTRDELVDAEWQVEVPAELEVNLREEGVLPPP